MTDKQETKIRLYLYSIPMIPIGFGLAIIGTKYLIYPLAVVGSIVLVAGGLMFSNFFEVTR